MTLGQEIAFESYSDLEGWSQDIAEVAVGEGKVSLGGQNQPKADLAQSQSQGHPEHPVLPFLSVFFPGLVTLSILNELLVSLLIADNSAEWNL